MDFHETQVSQPTMDVLLTLPEVVQWFDAVHGFATAPELKASAVHTRTGDRVDHRRRLSYSRSGRCPSVFDAIDALLPELAAEMTGSLAVYRGHYDFLYYTAGGFFSKHVDHVSAYGPGVCCWHALLCLDADGCVGGETVLHTAPEPHRSRATVTAGGLLAIRSGVSHEGAVVAEGRKVLLKFEVFQFEAPPHPAFDTDTVTCCCCDGEVEVERRLLLRQPFFEKLDSFEGPRPRVRLSGMVVADCRALRAFLLGDQPLADSDAAAAHDVIAYLAGPESVLAEPEFAQLCHDQFLKTGDRDVAERLAALAAESRNYVFLGVVHCWTVNVQDAWDLCLDSCSRESFAASLCVVASGHVALTTWPGPKWHREKDSGFIFLPDLNKDVHIYDAKGLPPKDSFQSMDAILTEQVCAETAEVGSIRRQPRRRSKFTTTPQPPVELTVAAGARLAQLLLRRATQSEFKQVLEASVGMARFRHEVQEDACNDGESYFTTTLYESRIYEFEWALLRRELLEGAH
jgi:hypothetical protein